MGEHGQSQGSYPHPGGPYAAQPAQYAQQPYPQPPYQYVYVAAPPPPPPPPPARKRRRTLWIVLTYVVVFSVLGAGAWFVPPLIWPGPTLTGITHPGPTSVQGLIGLLAAPAQATVGGTEELNIDEIAAAVDPKDTRSQVRALRDRGFRWGASLKWTGDDGTSKGTVRFTQFATVKGAQMHHLKLLLVERERTTAEETSIVEVPGAALFTDEDLDGEIVRATFGRGTITGEISVIEASGHVRNDVLALVVSLAEALPDDRWDWTDPAVTPIDLAAMLVPPPTGARVVTKPEEFRLSELAKVYVDVDSGADYLQGLGFRRGVMTEWAQADNVLVSVTLTHFGTHYGAQYFIDNTTSETERHHPESAPGEAVAGGWAHYYGTSQGFRAGYATIYRGDVAAQIYLVSARAIDKANLVALVQQQYDRLV